jgi:D-alanyl-D-alanine carboxypeptidase
MGLRFELGLTRLLVLFAVVSGCAAEVPGQSIDHEEEPEVDVSQQALVDCAARSDTGYRDGQSFPITVIQVDGKPVERETANHYVALQSAAARAGVAVRISSGFRTMAEQEYFYGCYINCNCNNCNLAARPGYSNHQSGRALDLNTSAAGVLNWLNANAGTFGFARTVSSEPWHWEWVGGGASVDACGGAVGADGCTATERNNAAQFGCACVNHQASGGYCDGSGCTAQENSNAAQFGCQCVDHQPSGGFCPNSGCTARETLNAAQFGCQCVDHQAAGGWCDGSGCTALEITNCAKFGCGCVDHQCAGGWCDGTGCTARETDNCAKVGCGCVDHQCAGGFCAGTGCTARETDNCAKVGCDCKDHKCAGGFCAAN